MRKSAVQREPIVNPDHLTPEHRKYLNYNSEDFIAWARTVGDSTVKVITYFLSAGKEAEQGYKACASLTRLCEKYGKKELEMACTEVLSYTSSPSIRLISTILKNRTYKSASPKPEPHDYTNAYGITRGAAYYAKNGKDGEGR